MKAVTVNLSVIAIILLVIFASGNQGVAGYLSQSIYQGQSVFVQDEETAFINDEYASVMHTGFTYTDGFSIREIVDLNGTDYVFLDHSVKGVFDKPSYRFTNITGTAVELQDDISFDDWELTYVGSFTDDDGLTMYIYAYENLTVAISTDDFAVVQNDGRSLLVQQLEGTIIASEIEEPFSIGMHNIAFLISFLIVIGIVAYWIFKKREDWRIVNESRK